VDVVVVLAAVVAAVAVAVNYCWEAPSTWEAALGNHFQESFAENWVVA
jgi:hypothetical protein